MTRRARVLGDDIDIDYLVPLRRNLVARVNYSGAGTYRDQGTEVRSVTECARVLGDDINTGYLIRSWCELSAPDNCATAVRSAIGNPREFEW